MSDDRFEETLKKPAAGAIVPTAGQMADKRPVVPSRGSISVKSTPSFTLTATGLQVVGNATEAEWEALAESVAAADGSLSWIMGDLFIFGANKEWGAYKRFAAKFHLEWRRIENYIYTCRNVDFTLRSVNLSYSHHRLVAPFYDEDKRDATRTLQRKLLDYAAEHQLTVAEFATFIASLPSGTKTGESSPAALDRKELAIVAPPFYEEPLDRLQRAFLKRWQSAAKEERQEAVKRLKALIKELERME